MESLPMAMFILAFDDVMAFLRMPKYSDATFINSCFLSNVSPFSFTYSTSRKIESTAGSATVPVPATLSPIMVKPPL